MACSGCQQRAELIRQALRAVTRGEGEGTLKLAQDLGRTLADDARSLKARVRAAAHSLKR